MLAPDCHLFESGDKNYNTSYDGNWSNNSDTNTPPGWPPFSECSNEIIGTLQSLHCLVFHYLCWAVKYSLVFMHSAQYKSF